MESVHEINVQPILVRSEGPKCADEQLTINNLGDCHLWCQKHMLKNGQLMSEIQPHCNYETNQPSGLFLDSQKWHKTGRNWQDLVDLELDTSKNRPNTLVCDDDEFDMSHSEEIKRYGPYFKTWSQIDVYCHFRHRLVTIPPPGLIKVAKLNGCRVIGTLIWETSREESHPGLLEILSSEESIERFSDFAAALCQYYSFDGWLINVETSMSPNYVQPLLTFVRLIREKVERRVPNDRGFVVWFDSVLNTGELRWQSGVNEKNSEFCEAANSILLNYWWNSERLALSKVFVESLEIPQKNLYVGIDVYSRGCVGKFDTWKSKSLVQNVGQISTAYFAPGYTFRVGPEKLYEKRDALFWQMLSPFDYHRAMKLKIGKETRGILCSTNFYGGSFKGCSDTNTESRFCLLHGQIQPSLTVQNLTDLENLIPNHCQPSAFNLPPPTSYECFVFETINAYEKFNCLKLKNLLVERSQTVPVFLVDLVVPSQAKLGLKIIIDSPDKCLNAKLCFEDRYVVEIGFERPNPDNHCQNHQRWHEMTGVYVNQSKTEVSIHKIGFTIEKDSEVDFGKFELNYERIC